MTQLETFAANYFRTLVQSFIAHPAELKVTAQEGPDWITVRPHCDSRDFGRIVGAGGNTYKLLTILMELAGQKAGKKFILQRIPNTNGPRETIRPAQPKHDWNAQDTAFAQGVLKNILNGVLVHDAKITPSGDAKRTVFKIKLNDNEPLEIQHEALTVTVSRILNAIGRAHGRDIYVEQA